MLEKYFTLSKMVFDDNIIKIEVKNNICINMFGYENRLVLPTDASNQTFGDSIDLLPLIDDDSQCRNIIRSSLFQLSNKNSNKSQI